MLTLKKFVYSFSKDNPPEAHACSGDVVQFISHDCFEGQIKSEADHEENIDFTHTNPATGPLSVSYTHLDVYKRQPGAPCHRPR